MKCKRPDCHSHANSSGQCPNHERQSRQQPKRKCERCGNDSGVERLGGVVACEHCLMLILVEWRRRRQEFGDLVAS